MRLNHQINVSSLHGSQQDKLRGASWATLQIVIERLLLCIHGGALHSGSLARTRMVPLYATGRQHTTVAAGDGVDLLCWSICHNLAHAGVLDAGNFFSMSRLIIKGLA